MGAVTVTGRVSGSASAYSSARGSVYALLILDGQSSTQSRADAWVGLPFMAGALPDEIEAIVWVSNALYAQVFIDELTSSVVAESLSADVEVDTAGATIEITNEITAEVT